VKFIIKILISLVYLALLFYSCQSNISNPLGNKTICIDPGHGGTAATDSFRVGSGGEREEWINLRVALHLKGMLQKAGANVILTRYADEAMGLKDRALLAVEKKSDVFVSIHHNATADSTVNFPIIYFHGNASENQASVQLGKLLAISISKELFNSDTPVSLVSDHVIFPNSGTAVLRHSYGIPGIIGESSFFTNPKEEQRLKNEEHNNNEAQAYFEALKEFFKQETLSIIEKYSTIKIEPFPVLQEAERMSDIAKLWKQDFEQAKELFKSGNKDALQKALELFTRSARSFPDSWLAGQAHYYRARIFKLLGENNKSELEIKRIDEFYPLSERKIRQAASAATYPLSIFTTIIPLAQLFNIESKAIRPLNEVL
jgi:N-acetylmuramoyl-L-alanine amidase